MNIKETNYPIELQEQHRLFKPYHDLLVGEHVKASLINEVFKPAMEVYREGGRLMEEVVEGEVIVFLKPKE